MSELINQNRGLYIFESIVFILLGIAAIAIPQLFTYSTEILVGCLLVIGGIIQGYRSLKSSEWGAMISAMISLIVGILLLAFPITGIVALTLLIAIFFLIEGLAQLYLGFKMRELKGWGLMIFSGIVSLLLAGIIWSELPGSATWVIGLLLGINLLIFGFSQLFLVLGTPKQ